MTVNEGGKTEKHHGEAMRNKTATDKEGRGRREGGGKREINGRMEGSKAQGGATGLDSPAVSPVGAACVAAGRLSPLPANLGHAGIHLSLNAAFVLRRRRA